MTALGLTPAVAQNACHASQIPTISPIAFAIAIAFALYRQAGRHSKANYNTPPGAEFVVFGALKRPCKTYTVLTWRIAPTNKNGLPESKPLICLVAGTGFEPVTFGL
jgi:hypothetical protein